MNEHLLHWADASVEAADNGVERRRIHGANAGLVRVHVPAGVSAPAHSHPHEQFVAVLRGAGTLTTPAGTQRFAAGDVFHFPPHTEHAAIFVEDTELLEINLAGS